MIRTLHDDNLRTPFIVLSGFATLPATVEAMKLGAAAVLEKPVWMEEALSAVRQALAPVLSNTPAGPDTQPAMWPATVAEAVAALTGRHGPGSAANRWALNVLRVCEADSDPRTLAEWARLIGVSYRSLRESCYVVGIPPHDARDFARILRAAVRASVQACDIASLLDVADVRTVKELLRRAGIDAQDLCRPGGFELFLRTQTFIATANPGCAALRNVLFPSRRVGH